MVNTGIKKGDSGGPLIMVQDGRFFQIGVIIGKPSTLATARVPPGVISSLDYCKVLTFVRKVAFGEDEMTCTGNLFLGFLRNI